MSVRQRLSGIGRALGDFNQLDFKQGRTDLDGVAIGGGYCAGVALDWARRVLQSAPNRYEKYLTYAGPKTPLGGARQVETLRRMVAAYAGQSPNYVNTTVKTELLPKLKALAAQGDGRYKDGSFGVQVPRAVLTQVKKFIDFQGEAVPDVVPSQRIQGWHDFIVTESDPQHEPLALDGREWTSYAQDLDRRFSEGRTKTFGKIGVLDSRELQTYESEGAWLGELRGEGFRNTCCTLVYLAPPEKNGHVVAVHQVGTDYRFFDPNYGAYEYSAEKLKVAFQHLFWSAVWKDDPGLDPELPVYRRRTAGQEATDAWTRMAYTVFKANP